MLIANTELSSLVRKGMNDIASEMSSDEVYRFGLVMLKAFRGHETAYAQHRSGLLDNLSYDGLIANMTIWMNSPHFESWWESTSAVYNRDVHEHGR
jgi:hypothetical protein